MLGDLYGHMDDAELRPLVGFWFPKITQKPFDLFCSQIPSCPAALGWLGGTQGVFKIYTLYIFTDYFFSILYSHFSSLWIFFTVDIFGKSRNKTIILTTLVYIMCCVTSTRACVQYVNLCMVFKRNYLLFREVATSVVYSKFLCISPPL